MARHAHVEKIAKRTGQFLQPFRLAVHARSTVWESDPPVTDLQSVPIPHGLRCEKTANEGIGPPSSGSEPDLLLLHQSAIFHIQKNARWPFRLRALEEPVFREE